MIYIKDVQADFLKFYVASQKPDEYLLMMESWVKGIDIKDSAEASLNQLVVNGTLSVNQ